MKMSLKIAVRNLRRNVRRSLATGFAIALSAAAMLCLGGFIANTQLSAETLAIRTTGHLEIFRAGYLDFGVGDPGTYSIYNYTDLIARLRKDQALAGMTTTISPAVYLLGLASNPETGSSRTFLGLGYVPSDMAQLHSWDPYGVGMSAPMPGSGLASDRRNGVVVGVRLARVLGLCDGLAGVTDCPKRPSSVNQGGGDPDEALLALGAMANADTSAASSTKHPHLDLMAATAGGAPNVINVDVLRAQAHPTTALDETYLAMPFSAAQNLLYGRGHPGAVAVIIQLRRTKDIAVARARLEKILDLDKMKLEVRDFEELVPMYRPSINLFYSIFLFVSIMLGVIVLFTVGNTMGMAVVERTAEIGSVRAMGVRRSGIIIQFTLEGALLGAIGATVGCVLAVLIAVAVNLAHFPIVLPGQGTSDLQLRLSWDMAPLAIVLWIALVMISAFAACAPAWRAARMPVVDALRHV